MKKNTLIAFIILIIVNKSLFAQSPNWLWAKHSVGSGVTEGYSVATDASANVYIAGDFTGATISFGSIVLTNANSASHDMFLVKYDSTGNLQWAINIGGTENETAQAISTDANGNVVVTGYFTDSALLMGALFSM